MTFSILGTDSHGRFGMAVSSSSPAVAARCIHLRAGVGGAASQNITDPRLGGALLDALASGSDASAALASVLAGCADADYRQLMVVDSAGRTAHFSGGRTLGVHAEASGPSAVAAGNLLASSSVPGAMVRAFAESSGELESRLVGALAAGLSAGGEAGPVRSAGLAVVDEVPWRVSDLRVDWHDDPIGSLAELVERWLPQRDEYVTRGLDPSSAPSFGVPGDR